MTTILLDYVVLIDSNPWYFSSLPIKNILTNVECYQFSQHILPFIQTSKKQKEKKSHLNF